ncbi:MAG: protein-glutamate O-methyltransferase CheR [Gemmatimonadota bacterium]|nr:protein-glutamate O-methyltransferase CheR [Gemmatimonadota bacterium]MDH4351675.1 protein-glutamate O-methyltransferase CheR [Gemmatimonadota bacterium]MDH5196220.1 protein-glutamate O-methyltransferase CheR [Gemmatimonadota bacterium]
MTVAPEDGLGDLLAQIAGARGLTCDGYKPNCLRRRLAVRMRARGVHTYAAYAAVLRDDAHEYDRLLDALTINVTKFFRNREAWDVLATRFLPDLWERRRGALRCWSAGCATGEEPYTLAIALLEQARRGGTKAGTYTVDATDLDPTVLDRARAGVYRTPALDETSPALVERYFTGRDPWEVGPEVRTLVRFHRHDLLREPPPDAPYDIITCRNVVIYFERANQERLYHAFADALQPGGILMLGKVETLVGDVRERFQLEDIRERIYRRR